MYLSISGEEKISQYQVDPFSGQMEFVQHVKVAGKPAPLAISPDRRFLYVGNRGPLVQLANNDVNKLPWNTHDTTDLLPLQERRDFFTILGKVDGIIL